ncbi:MAG TPA: hypothetical protein V6D14_06795 [Coleofasciculaceae cyanobacterium]
MGALTGLVLFLYGVTRMAEGLREVAGERLRYNNLPYLQGVAMRIACIHRLRVRN